MNSAPANDPCSNAGTLTRPSHKLLALERSVRVAGPRAVRLQDHRRRARHVHARRAAPHPRASPRLGYEQELVADFPLLLRQTLSFVAEDERRPLPPPAKRKLHDARLAIVAHDGGGTGHNFHAVNAYPRA